MEAQSIHIQENLISEPVKQSPVSWYKNIPLNPNTNSSVQLNANGNPQSTIQIPPGNVYNNWYSALSFVIPNLKGVAIGAGTQTSCNTFSNFFPWINKLEFFTSNNNTYLVNVSQVDTINKMISSCELNYEKRKRNLDPFLYDSWRGQQTVGNQPNPPTFTALDTESIVPTGRIIAPVSNNYGGSILCDTNLYGTAISPANYGNISLVGSVDSPSYYETGEFDANLSQLARTVNIPLRDILPGNSIFSVDKDIYSSNVLYLRITWNNVNKLGFGSIDNDLTAPAKFVSMASINPTITITNITLNMYIQANPEICQMIVERSRQQEIIMVPMLQTNSYQMNGTSQNTTFKITSTNPLSRLWKSYYGVFNADAYTNGALIQVNNNNNDSGSIEIGGGQAYQKYGNLQLYLDGELYLQLNQQRLDFYRYVVDHWKNHSYPTLLDYNENPAIAILYDSDCVHSDKVDPYIVRGKTLRNNECQINHNITTTNSSFTHYIATCLLQPIYMKQGVLSVIPFE